MAAGNGSRTSSRKVRVLPGALAVSRLEQASVELATSSSAPAPTCSTGCASRLAPAGRRARHPARDPLRGDRRAAGGRREHCNGGVDRLAFFGRFEERKGVRAFVAGVNALSPKLLERIELEFVGKPDVRAVDSGDRRAAIRHCSRNAAGRDLRDQPRPDGGVVWLSRPGTLAVMPSLEDNSPSVVYEVPSNAGSVSRE